MIGKQCGNQIRKGGNVLKHTFNRTILVFDGIFQGPIFLGHLVCNGINEILLQ